MDVLTTKLKTSLRIDGNEEDSLLEGYILAAKLFIKHAIVADDDSFFDQDEIKPLVELAVLALAGSYYTYRISLVDTQTYPVDLTLKSIIGQLRGMYAKTQFGGDLSDQKTTV